MFYVLSIDRNSLTKSGRSVQRQLFQSPGSTTHHFGPISQSIQRNNVHIFCKLVTKRDCPSPMTWRRPTAHGKRKNVAFVAKITSKQVVGWIEGSRHKNETFCRCWQCRFAAILGLYKVPEGLCIKIFLVSPNQVCYLLSVEHPSYGPSYALSNKLCNLWNLLF